MIEQNEVPRAKNFGRTFARFLRDLGILASPAGVIALVCQIMNLSARVTAEVSIAVLLITAVIFFASSLEKRLHVAIPACIVVILSAVLIHVLLTLKQPAPEDPWQTWQRQIEKKVAECENENKNDRAVYEICIGQAISQEYPKPKTNLSAEVLHNDLHAGAVLMTMSPVKDLLYKRLGIKDHFLGDGFAQPSDKEKPDALVPEYFAANLTETHTDVWTWPLRQFLDNSIGKYRKLSIPKRTRSRFKDGPVKASRSFLRLLSHDWIMKGRQLSGLPDFHRRSIPTRWDLRVLNACLRSPRISLQLDSWRGCQVIRLLAGIC